jgi:exonuclease SbcC
LAETEQEIESLEAELDALDEQRNALTSQIAATQAELDQLQVQTASLEAAETATCPLCEGPLTPEHRSELLARNEARLEEIKATLAKAQSQRNKVEKKRQRKQKALGKLEKRVKDLPRLAEADNLSTQIGTQKKAVTKIERKLAELADTPAEIERLTAELEVLGDPRRDYQRLSDTADRRGAVEKDLAASEGQITELSGQIDVIEKELAAFADLDERTKAERAVLTAQEADHQRYLEHIREAEALGERQEKVAALGKELETAQAECERIVVERDQVAVDHDAEAYAELTKAYNSLQGEVARLEERLYQQRSQLEEAQAEIDRLVDVQSELEAARAECEELGELLSLLKYIRDVLRDAGPKVTQALVEVISIQAARLYADIMADHMARLRWTDDYEIVLTASGRERTFKQLSGGEQMAAALAVRLALLRQVSGIDVAFFDEPTANLDDHRRDNLAEQILNVKGFSQLFVISHDDTFERDTDNVVRLVKENGVSRVEE